MLMKLKIPLAAILVACQISLGLICKSNGDWKAFILGIGYAACNVVIFIL
jgi:hypothetical protein